MLIPILLILTSTAASLVEGVVIKKYNTKHTGGGFLFTGIVSLFSMLFFVVTDKNGFDFRTGVFVYGIISGIMYCSASVYTYIALECGSFAMTMLILSYTILFSIVYGIAFLGEKATAFTYIGFALLMLSIYFMNGKNVGKRKVTAKWIAAMLISFVGCGGYGIIQRMQQIHYNDACTNEYMIVTLGFSAIVLIVIGAVRERGGIGAFIKIGGLYAAGAGVSNGATNFFALVLNTLIPISIAAPMRSGAKIVISFLVSVLIFRERFEKRQLAGLILGALALIFLNL